MVSDADRKGIPAPFSPDDIDEAKNAVDDCVARLGETNGETLDAMANLASLYVRLGDLPAARSLQDKVLARRQLLDSEDWSTLRATNDLANSLQKLNELELARRLQEGNLRTLERLYGSDAEVTMIIRQNLASIRYEAGDLAGTVELQQQNVEGFHRLFGNRDPRTIRARGDLSYTKYHQGDYLGAIPMQLRFIAESLVFRRRLRRAAAGSPFNWWSTAPDPRQ